jgi:hypothetical protein
MDDKIYISENLKKFKDEYETTLQTILDTDEKAYAIYGVEIFNHSTLKGHQLSPDKIGRKNEFDLTNAFFGSKPPFPSIFIITNKYLHLIKRDVVQKCFVWYKLRYQDIVDFLTNYVEGKTTKYNERLIIFIRSRRNPFVIVTPPVKSKRELPFQNLILGALVDFGPSNYKEVHDAKMQLKYGNDDSEKITKSMINKDLTFKSVYETSERSAHDNKKQIPVFIFTSEFMLFFVGLSQETYSRFMPVKYILTAGLSYKPDDEAVIEKIRKISDIGKIISISRNSCYKDTVFSISIKKPSTSNYGTLRIEWVIILGEQVHEVLELKFTSEETLKEILSFFEDFDKDTINIA